MPTCMCYLTMECLQKDDLRWLYPKLPDFYFHGSPYTCAASPLSLQRSRGHHSELLEQTYFPQVIFWCPPVCLLSASARPWGYDVPGKMWILGLCLLEGPHCLPRLAPKSTPANWGHRKRHFPVSQDGHCLPSRVGDSSALGSVSRQAGRFWERQKSQLPQFPNMSNRVPALCATSAPLHVGERCFEGGHISLYYYFVINGRQSPRVLAVVA